MNRRSPTLEGFKVMFARPSVGAAEISWRWSIGFAVALLVTGCVLEYLDTLPVSRGDMLFLSSGQPVLISQAVSHIFRGSAPRLIEALVVIAIAFAIGWIVIGSLGRIAVVKALLGYFRTDEETEKSFELSESRLPSLIGINFLRAAVMVAAIASTVGAALAAAVASPERNPSPAAAFFLFLLIVAAVWVVWSFLNWFLSLAAVLAVIRGEDTFSSMKSSIDLCQRRLGSVFAAGTWFGIAHVAAFFIATSAVAFPFAFAGILPGGLIFGGVLLVTLLYFAVVDFLYVGRLGAYVALLELPMVPVAVAAPIPAVPVKFYPINLASSGSVDKDEKILSDVAGGNPSNRDFQLPPPTADC